MKFPGFRRWDLVKFRLNGCDMVGVIGEKVAGGLYEVVVEVDGGHFSSVCRTDELVSAKGTSGVQRRASGSALTEEFNVRT
jgi:hypothetical protein